MREDAERHGRQRTLDEQLALLEAVIAADEGEERDIGEPPIDLNHNLYLSEREAFPEMVERVRGGRALTPKQLGWVLATAKRLGVSTPSAEPVPRGREVEPAPALRQLPKAPPGRKPLPEPAPARPVKVEREAPCTCGGQGMGYGGFHYRGAHGCLHASDFSAFEAPPAPTWLWAFARLLDLPRGSVERTYEAARRLDRLCMRAPEGDINNCALVAGEAERDCSICQGTCPDRDRIGAMINVRIRRIGEGHALEERRGTVVRTSEGDIVTSLPGESEDDIPF